MRSPSGLVLKDRADIYVAPRGRDVEGGVTFPYSTTPTYSKVPCTIQAQGYGEVMDEQQRITQVIEYKVMTSDQVIVTPRDQIIYVDSLGVSHTLIVESTRDEAGRGSAFTIRATERI